MSLESGRRLGPYEIVSLLGIGGMGEVYRANDTRLDRVVAIKVLPSGFSANVHLRERFEREARAISALSHPNICALYDVGSVDDIEYLVMEYLEGETLAERLVRGPLPTSQIFRYGAQIAEALQSAHRAGITHRDLKPGNIMITGGGTKLLDFGLAKVVESSTRVFSDRSAPETKASPLTAEGSIVGTFQYMSPEQLEGKSLDHRTDIFSLGVILYEMATGQRPFRGDSPASLIASILSSDPQPLRLLQPNAPPVLERIIVTALEKGPDERWQTAHDVGRQLRWAGESSSAEQPAPPRRRHVATVGVVLMTAVIAGSLTWGAMRVLAPRQVPEQSVRFLLVPPAELGLSNHPELNSSAISPDGRALVLRAASGGQTDLYLRRLDSFEIAKIEGTEGAVAPFWSPDSNWIGFSSAGMLKKTRVTGGTPPEVICEISRGGARASWSGDRILFADARGERVQIFLVGDDGGAPVKVTTLQPGEWRHSWPVFLADGEHFLYLSFMGASLERKVVLKSLASGGESALLSNVSQVMLSGRDSIAYVRDGTLLEQRVDIGRGSMIGEPKTIASDVTYFYPTARAVFDASPAGVIVYQTDTSTGRLTLSDRHGKEIRVFDDGDIYWDHAISPDGKRAAVTVVARGTGLMDIWIYDLARGVRDRFTSDPAIEVSPGWAPDGQSIVYSKGEGGTFPHLVRRALASSNSDDLTPRDAFQFGAAFSPDGESVYYERDSGTGFRIFRLVLKTRESEPALGTSHAELQSSVSPDGKWLAFVSYATGSPEVYLQSLAGEPARIRISSAGGLQPRWRGDGKELFYLALGGEVMSAMPGANGAWNDAALTALFRQQGAIRGFAATPDGQSFLISTWTPGPTDEFLHVILRGN